MSWHAKQLLLGSLGLVVLLLLLLDVLWNIAGIILHF